MGLFTKKNPYEKEALDLEAAMRDIPERPDPRMRPTPPQPTSNHHPQQAMQQQHHQAPTPPPMQQQAPKTNYGIEDAIRLMRELPDNKKEMVITIVQKTLISAKVNVGTIIDDAARKIDRLEKKNEKLGQEIRELEEAIHQRKVEMDKNARDVEETREVKISFESTYPRMQMEDTQVQRQPHHSQPPQQMQRDRDQPPVSHSPMYIPSQKAG